jgi:hypothetical protein
MANGLGTTTFPNGDVISGNFVDNKFVSGSRHFADGHSDTGKYDENNKLVDGTLTVPQPDGSVNTYTVRDGNIVH